MPNSYVQDALPVAIAGTPGSQVSLLDVLKQAYGDQIGSISSVNIGYYGADYLLAQSPPFAYWDLMHTSVTSVLNNGVDIGASTQNNFHTVTIDSAQFAKVMIDVGNNIMPNVYIQVPTAHNSDGSTDYQELNVTTIPSQFVQTTALGSALDPAASHQIPILTALGNTALHPVADAPFQSPIASTLSAGFVPFHVPTAADIVASAEHVAALKNGLYNDNDCHFIAMDIAAAVGAPLDPNTQTATDIGADGKVVTDSSGHPVVTETPANNEEGGFWRIAYRGSDANPVSDWQTLVKPGDIVRLSWDAKDGGGFHTFTVTEGQNVLGQIEVVDNTDHNTIAEHWVNYESISQPASVTIYRLTTDGLNLIDEVQRHPC